jgi:hypothetical protein
MFLLGWWLWPRRKAKAVDASDPETVRRFWTLHRPDGNVPLGTMTQLEAVQAAAKMGARVTFVDREFALIFADTHLATERHESGGEF